VLRVFLFALFCFVSSLAQANAVAEQLARAGANDLALQKLEQSLLGLAVDSQAWLTLKRKQVAVMKTRGLYRELSSLLAADIEASVEGSNRRWLQNQQIEAFLEAGDPVKAMTAIRKALWNNANSYDPEVLDAIANWRRQLVEARVLAAQFDLAADTLARYENDYQIESDVAALRPGIQRWPWRYKPRFNQELKRSRARLFLESREFGIAADLLKDDEHPQVQHVRLLSLLHTNRMTAAEVYKRALEMAQDKSLGLPARKSAWVLAAEAARSEGLFENGIEAIKQAMITAPELPYSESLLSMDESLSWFYLETIGVMLLQRRFEGQPIGAVAQNLSLSGLSAPQQQAVMVELYRRSESAEQKADLLGRIIEVEPDANVRRQLLPRWLLNNDYVDEAALSPALRYQIAELALEAGDIPLAAELMQQLDAAPTEVSAVEWQLRRARVLVLAAKAEQGVLVLHSLLDGNYGGAPQLDRFLQAVFDVQAVGENKAAIALFQRLLSSDIDQRQRREIHYWLADAAKADENYSLAAEHYLLSAGEKDNSWDPWGVSARRQAADALKAGGLLQDAVNVYQRLLDRSQDRTERAVLRTNIQRLKAQL
jgi:hypothetical protein